MSDSIDIKQIYSAFKPRLPHLNGDKNTFGGAFFEFPENSRKGHRFLLEFSENYQFYFAIKPECPGAYRLSDAPAFLFSEIYHLGGLMGVRNHVQ